MDSEEEGFYYSSSDDCGDEEPYCNTTEHYTILKEERIRQLQENDISEVSSVLSVSRGVACTLLLRKNWNISSVFDEWFTDEETIREAVGISTKQKSLKLENYCKICLETIEVENMLSAACGHPFCVGCWKSYVTISIEDGPGCLTLCCPEPKCKAIAGLDMVEWLMSADDRHKYYQYLHRSYVELSRNRKWCPAPGCESAVEFAGGCKSFDVTCDCSYKFCWNCTEESHRPVDCATVAKWIEKNNSEEDNNTWIKAFTKPCPKCHRNIEKSQGCHHMTCGKPCGFEFCWLCLRPWTSYGDDTCNRYNDEDEKPGGDSLEATRKYLQRYAHYYERWASNHKSRDTARADLNRVRKEHIPVLSLAQAEPAGQLQFVIEAWDQIVECRHVLKWTYAYGYYVEVDKLKKKTFFEYLQGQAEAALERLHYCAEKEMEKYMKADQPLEDFRDFRAKLTCLTAATRDYFQNLVRALENDLSEVSVDSTQACTSTQARRIGGKH